MPTKDFPIWFDVIQSQPILDKKSINESSHKKSLDMFKVLNSGTRFGRYFGEHLSLFWKKDFFFLIFALINTNPIRKKCDLLVLAINGSIEVLTTSETKLDDSFPPVQFHISPFRLHGNAYGGSILVFAREDIPRKNSSIEKFHCIWNEKKWSGCCSYNPHRIYMLHYLSSIGSSLDLPVWYN